MIQEADIGVGISGCEGMQVGKKTIIIIYTCTDLPNLRSLNYDVSYFDTLSQSEPIHILWAMS